MMTHPQPRTTGFTLIELMITVAIVGILAAVAFPSYQNQIQKGKRAEGKAALLNSASKMERYYSDNNFFPSNSASCGGGTTSALALAAAGIPVFSGESTTKNAYDITVTFALGAGSACAQVYTLTATPKNWTDATCGNLSITNTATKGNTGTGAVQDCW